MLDRFKFRGLGIFSEKWIYGNLIKKEEQTYITNNGIISYATAVMQKTVKQCTGIKDKKGKLIFEGDLVTIGKYIFEIIFELGGFHLYDRSGQMISKIGGDNDHCYPLSTLYLDNECEDEMIHILEIIGNICENQ